MSASVNIHVSDLDIDRIRSCEVNATLVSVDLDSVGDITFLGPLDKLIAVFGRAHEQLLALQAARTTIPARAVLIDGALQLVTATGHGLGWLDVGGSQGFAVGDELLIQWDDDGDGWAFVRWIRDVEDIAGIDFSDGHAAVTVTAPEDSE